MYEELIERLREYPDREETAGGYVEVDWPDLLDAADAIESLDDRLAALQYENGELRSALSRVEAEQDAAITDVAHDCEHCKHATGNGACKLLPDGDQFSPDYTEGFDRDGNCDHWKWRGAQGEGRGMERLTKWATSVQGKEKICCRRFDGKVCWDYTGQCSDGCPFEEQAWSRLAAYEDTGLKPEDIKKAFDEETVLKLASQTLGTTPERLRELVKAQDEGRVVVLPCKPSDVTVYQLRGKKHTLGIGVSPRHISCATVWADGDYALHHQGADDCQKKDFGKTWFLTCAEAEAALDGGKNG